MLRVGIISGRETFASELLNELSRRPGVTAEWVRVGATSLECPDRYDVIMDRLSHCYEFYQAYLKREALRGTYVINNPFRFLCDDKFFNYALAQKLGVPTPKTVLLPSREYDERVLDPQDLHNLDPRIDWDRLLEHLGLPVVFKPFDGYGWREVYIVEDKDSLIALYEESLMDVMMLQEFIDYEHYVRCFVVGTEEVLACSYDPRERRYILDHSHLTPELGLQINESCRLLCGELGYDLNTVEFAIRDGVPFAIDFMNPVPEAKPEVITPTYFDWLIRKVADFVIKVGREQRRTPHLLR